eukprot:5230875-Heterocapsa_arctica.AAC.1
MCLPTLPNLPAGELDFQVLHRVEDERRQREPMFKGNPAGGFDDRERPQQAPERGAPAALLLRPALE